MLKEEWGVKRVCPTTGKRFYDLNRSPIVSPYTGEVVTLDSAGKTRAVVKEDKVKSEKAKSDDLLEGDEVLEEDDTDVDLGDEVLEDDDEDNVSLDDIADVSSDDDDT